MLHIHNGESTAYSLREAQFPGEHFAFKDVLSEGPTPSGLRDDEWRRLRSRFLEEEYLVQRSKADSGLLEQERVLNSYGSHDEVVLWFEHDLFCMINLLYLLDWFSHRQTGSTRLSLICIGEFPGVADFRGLGQLTGEQLASLFESRTVISEPVKSLGARAWEAYSSSTPDLLLGLVTEDCSAIPFLKQAVILHLARFPSTKNGLNEIQQHALDLISAGKTTFRPLFVAFGGLAPCYGLGDSQFLKYLEGMASVSPPIISLAGDKASMTPVEDALKRGASLELTEIGRAICDASLDLVNCCGIDHWLGGVQLTDSQLWRWDAQSQTLTGSQRQLSARS